MDKDWLSKDDMLATVEVNLNENGKQVASGTNGAKLNVEITGAETKEEENSNNNESNQDDTNKNKKKK
jgi:hypothetical protein